MPAIALRDVHLNDYNPNTMDGSTYSALREDMKQSGPDGVDPILVRPVKDGYEVVDGEHRVRAARELGWKEIRARVQELTLEEAMEANYRKNRERGTLDPLKEGRLFKWWRNGKGLTQREIGERFGVDDSLVSRRIRNVEVVDDEAVAALRGLKKGAIQTNLIPGNLQSNLTRIEPVQVQSDHLEVPLEATKLDMIGSLSAERLVREVRLPEEAAEECRPAVKKLQVEVAQKIGGMHKREAQEYVKEKWNNFKLEFYRRKEAPKLMEKKRRLEAEGKIVVLEEEWDVLKNKERHTVDGEVYRRCLACPTPAVLLTKFGEKEVCANLPCWLKVRNEIERERRRREEEAGLKLEEQRSLALAAPEDVKAKVSLFLMSLEYRPGYLEEDNLYNRWNPVKQMTAKEALDRLFRTALEEAVTPAEPGDRVDVLQMKAWLADRCGLDKKWILGEGA